jgi:sugar/nucleoside kinase (ribokinase family)
MKTTALVNNPVQLIVFGEINRDFILTRAGKAFTDIPGGSALYFSIGAVIWKRERIGVISKVGDDFPMSKISFLKEYGVDQAGIRILPYPLDNRAFHSGIADENNPSSPPFHYLAVGSELPRALLGYDPKFKSKKKQFPNLSDRSLAIPPEYLKSNLAHFCSNQNAYQIALTALMQSKYPGLVSLFVTDVPDQRRGKDMLLASLNSVFCVFIKKTAMRDLFSLDSTDYESLQKHATQIKSEYVVVLLGEQGRILLDTRSNKKWFIPLYPIQAVNPTGKNHSFCGGFCAKVRENYDPVEAVLTGAVSSSLVASGVGLNFALEAPQELIETRFNRLRTLVRRL